MTDTGDRRVAANPLRPLLDVAEALVSSLVLEEALTNAAAAIGKAMSVSKVDIYAYDRERDVLVYEAKWDIDGLTPEKLAVIGNVIDLQARPSWRPILEGRIVELHVSDSDLPPEERAIYELNDQKTTLDAPLIAGGQVIGTLGVVQRDHVRRFTPLETDLFAEFCRIAAIGISNAKTFRSQKECALHLEALRAAGDTIASEQDDDNQLDVICRTATEALRVAACGIFAYAAATGTIICRAGHQLEGGTFPDCDDVDATAALHEPAARHEASTDGRTVIRRIHDPDLTTAQRETMARAGAGLCIEVPLRFAGRPVGLLRACDSSADRRFGDMDMRLIEALGTQAAVVLSRTV